MPAVLIIDDLVPWKIFAGGQSCGSYVASLHANEYARKLFPGPRHPELSICHHHRVVIRTVGNYLGIVN